jgi:hypothetical protein
LAGPRALNEPTDESWRSEALQLHVRAWGFTGFSGRLGGGPLGGPFDPYRGGPVKWIRGWFLSPILDGGIVCSVVPTFTSGRRKQSAQRGRRFSRRALQP